MRPLRETVVNKTGTMYLKAFGSFTYGDPAPYSGGNPPMTLDTPFDIARCVTCVTCVTFATFAMLASCWTSDVPTLCRRPRAACLLVVVPCSAGFVCVWLWPLPLPCVCWLLGVVGERMSV
jgi:hypothetical protein